MKNNRENLTIAAIIVMSSIVVSRITGFLRVVLITAKLGINNISDAYNIAFLIPDLMYTMLVGGATSAALIPILAGYIKKNEEKEGWKAVGTFINVSVVGMIIACFLGTIFAPQLVSVLVSSHAKSKVLDIDLVIKLTRILFPSVAFLMLAGFSNGILNSYKRFAAAAYGPSIYNVLCAFSIYFLGNSDKLSVQRVAYGVLASAILYFLFQFSFCFKNLKYYKFKIYLKHEGFIKLFNLAIPSLISSSIVQVNVIISNRFMTNFQEGSVTAFSMANTVWQLPFGIFAMGIGMAILPKLSEDFAIGNIEEFKHTFIKALKSVMIFTLPSAVALIIMRDIVIRVIFKWSDKVNESSIYIAGIILMFFSVAIISQSILAIVNRGFYANNDTKTPLFFGIITIGLNILFSSLFYYFAKDTLGAGGMAFAYSIISFINAIWATIILNKKLKGLHLRRLFYFGVRLIPGLICMGIFIFIFQQNVHIKQSSKIFQVAILGVEIFIGMLIYLSISILFKVDEVQKLYWKLKEKLVQHK